MNVDHIRGLMREQRLTVESAAKLLGLSPNGFREKLRCRTEFKVSEAQRLAEILRVPIAELIEDCLN